MSSKLHIEYFYADGYTTETTVNLKYVPHGIRHNMHRPVRVRADLTTEYTPTTTEAYWLKELVYIWFPNAVHPNGSVDLGANIKSAIEGSKDG